MKNRINKYFSLAHLYILIKLFKANLMINLLEFQILVQDDQIIDENLIDLLAHLAVDLERQKAVVTPAQFQSKPATTEHFAKQDSSLLNIEINLDTWQTCSYWLYKRLVGTTTKVRFEPGDLEFAFQERDPHDQQSAHKEFEAIANWMETSTRALNA